jgi:5-methylthioadenosine/S-adenosylhomocysteine deaminase
MILIKNGLILTMGSAGRVIKDGAIVIEEGIITIIGKTDEIVKEYRRSDMVIDARNKIVMPGLVNTHVHMFQSLLRGIGDDLPLHIWLKDIIWPLTKHLRHDEAYIGSLLSALEMIRTGTTCISDNMYVNVDRSNFDGVAEAIEKSGLRAILERGSLDNPPAPEAFQETPEIAARETEIAIKRWHGKADGRISVCPAPQNEEVSSAEMIRMLRYVANKYETRFHMHCAETLHRRELIRKKYGVGSVEYLYELDALGRDVLLAHCVWISDKEIHLLKETGTSVAHNPVSNQFLGDGVAPIPKLLEEGITVGIGTDGAASNNSLDMFQAMKMCALMQKVHNLNASVMNAYKVLEMATIYGARALGLEDEIGTLEKGKKADIILVNLKAPEMVPNIRPISHLVYSATGAMVDTVIIDGKIIMEGRKVRTIDEEKVLELAQKASERLVDRAGLYEKFDELYRR